MAKITANRVLRAYHVSYEAEEWRDGMRYYAGTRGAIVWAISLKRASALFQVQIDSEDVLVEDDVPFEISLVPRRVGVYYL